MLAFKWMDAHDKLHAGKPYEFPKPADLPDTVNALREALRPFAEAADFKESGYTFDLADTVYCEVTLGDCRKARSLSSVSDDGA